MNLRKLIFGFLGYLGVVLLLNTCGQPQAKLDETSTPTATIFTTNTTLLPAGLLYKGDYINIRSPNSDGWTLQDSSTAGMVFAKSGAEPNETFAAQVGMFPLAPTNNKEEFVSLIQQGADSDTDNERFDIIESEFNYSEERSYPCVEASAILEDKQAWTSSTTQEVLLLQMKSLFCRHPVRDDTGFAIIYSHRGESLYPNLNAEAQAFFNGVQVPGYDQ